MNKKILDFRKSTIQILQIPRYFTEEKNCSAVIVSQTEQNTTAQFKLVDKLRY